MMMGLKLSIVLKETKTTVEKKWLWNNVFRSKGTVNGQVCTLVVGGGSPDNRVHHSLVNRLKLKVHRHYHS